MKPPSKLVAGTTVLLSLVSYASAAKFNAVQFLISGDFCYADGVTAWRLVPSGSDVVLSTNYDHKRAYDEISLGGSKTAGHLILGDLRL